MNSSSVNVIVRPLVFIGCAAFLLAGCTTTPKTTAVAKEADGKKVVLGETDYEYVYLTGSNIPTRVPKTPISRPLLTSSPTKVISADDFEAWVGRGLTSGRP